MKQKRGKKSNSDCEYIPIDRPIKKQKKQPYKQEKKRSGLRSVGWCIICGSNIKQKINCDKCGKLICPCCAFRCDRCESVFCKGDDCSGKDDYDVFKYCIDCEKIRHNK
jgi:hypothetical protein